MIRWGRAEPFSSRGWPDAARSAPLILRTTTGIANLLHRRRAISHEAAENRSGSRDFLPTGAGYVGARCPALRTALTQE
jgi:hypothetical protein